MNENVYFRDIQIYCENVIRSVKPRSVILYGSLANGRFGFGSDIDIIVISENLPENFLERLQLPSELNTTMAPIEYKKDVRPH